MTGALRAAMVAAILDTPMHPVKPTTAQLVDAILAYPSVRAALAAPSTPEPNGSLAEWLRLAVKARFAHKDDRAVREIVLGLIEAGVRAAPSTKPALDVLRLTRAILNCDAERQADLGRGVIWTAGDWATAIAAEYARLAESQPALGTCGVLARCGRPKDHRGHHGGWRT